MKTQFLSRRSVLLALITAVSFTACKKETEPTADMATRVSGTYAYTELNMGGKTYTASQTNIKGSIELSKQTANTVTLDLNIRGKADNSEFLVGSVDDVELTDAGNGSIGLRVETDEVAKVKDGKLTLKATDDSGDTFEIVAVKK